MPLEKTIAALVKTRNLAATPTLLAALDPAGDLRIFNGVVQALVQRRNKPGHEAVVALWHKMGPAERAHFDGQRGRMAAALREAMLADDPQLFDNGCEIVAVVDEFELMPTLVTLVEQNHPQRGKPALALALELVARLEKMSHASVDARDQQNTDIIRQAVLECLQRSVERFRQHRRIELIEAFVALAGPANESLRAILDAPHHPCFATVVDILGRSESPAVIALLTTLLATHDGPQVIRNVVSKRTDRPFLAALLATRLDWSDAALIKSLGRIKQMAGLSAANIAQRNLSTAEQVAAIKLLAATGAPDEQKLDLAELLLLQGESEARLAACQALRPIAGQRANELVLRALEDADPQVQIAAAAQIRSRHIPGSIAKLVELAGSPNLAVQDAAREALPEFTIDGFLGQYDSLDETQRRSAAAVTARLDGTAPTRLRQELESQSVRRRMRAIDAITMMGLEPRVADALVERLSDDDHMVRTAAAEALQTCRSEDVRQALLTALGDRSSAVQSAARASLEVLAGR